VSSVSVNGLCVQTQHDDRNVQGHFCMFNQALQVYVSLSQHQKHDRMPVFCHHHPPPPHLRYPKEHHSSFFVFFFKIPTLRPLVLLIRAVLGLSNEHWCKVTDRGKGKYWENKTCPTATLSTTSPTWSGLGSKSSFRGVNKRIKCSRNLYCYLHVKLRL